MSLAGRMGRPVRSTWVCQVMGLDMVVHSDTEC